jgi:lipoate-protein ligase A
MYLIEHEDLDGPLNMALDEVLWHAAAEDGPYLRLYGWADRPSISLGYFQSCREVLDRPAWRHLPFVRRVTGGGALVHDRDMTYALTLPARLAPPTRSLYERVHRAFAIALRAIGVPCEVGPSHAGETTSQTLCFQRNDRFAVCVKGFKVLGSAQRRDSASVLIHGSLLLATSGIAPEIVGLERLAGQIPDQPRLRAAIVDAIAAELDMQIQRAKSPAKLLAEAQRFVELKYATREWNHLK